jgi:hypothetical protein
MKTIAIRRRILTPLTFSICAWLALAQAVDAQVYVANYGADSIGAYALSGAAIDPSLVTGIPRNYGGPYQLATDGNTLFALTHQGISEYNFDGSTVNSSLISLSNPGNGMAISGNDIFVATGPGTIGEFTTSGATVTPSLISGLDLITGMAISGNDLFVSQYQQGVISEYTLSGALVNPAVISGLYYPTALAISGNDLFVVNFNGANASHIGEYSLSGATINPSLVGGLTGGPSGLGVAGNDLYVGNVYSGSVGEYTLSGGTVDSSLITSLSNPEALLVVPEPSALSLVFAGAGAVWLNRRRPGYGK